MSGCGTDEGANASSTRRAGERSPAPEPHDATASAVAQQTTAATGPSAVDAGELSAQSDVIAAAPAASADGGKAAYLAGIALQRSGDLRGAEQALRSVLAVDPAHHGARINLARVLVRAGRPLDALVELDAATPASQARSDSWNVRGLALLEAEQLEEAEAAFANAVDLDPDNVHALNNRGLSLIKQGRFADAVEPLTRAASFEKAPAYVFNNLGVALERSGDARAACDAYARADAMGHGWAGLSLARLDSLLAAQGDSLASTTATPAPIDAGEKAPPETQVNAPAEPTSALLPGEGLEGTVADYIRVVDPDTQ